MKLLNTFFLLLFFSHAFAQQFPGLEALHAEQGTAVEDFDIPKIIKTPMDFDQSKLSIAQIDAKIISIINSQKNKTLTDVTFPINSRKIAYLGKMHPTVTGIFFSDYAYFLQNDQSLKGDSTHIFKYDNLYISSKSNRLMDRYLVYYTIRAYLLIKYRLKNINELLFNKTNDIPVNFLKLNPNTTYVNVTKNYFVTFDGINPLPENNAYFGKAYTPPNVKYEFYPNAQVIYMNAATILNGGSTGGVAIYKNITDPAQKFHKYMQDGFIHTFVHEKLHDWIFQYQHLNATADFLRKSAQSSGIVANYYSFEEAVVNNTTNILFGMENNKGGLSNDVLDFYAEDFEISISKFKNEGSYEKLKERMKRLSPENKLYRTVLEYTASADNKVFFIDFYNKANIPR